MKQVNCEPRVEEERVMDAETDEDENDVPYSHVRNDVNAKETE